MGRITFINSSIHSDENFKALTPSQQLLYFKLLTHPNGNKAGFYRIDIEYTAKMLMRCSEAKLRKDLNLETSLWKYDESTNVILLPNYLRYNKIAGPKALKGMMYDLELIPKTRLCVEFVYKLNELTDGEGVLYLPHKMKETALALSKDASDVQAAIVYKILCSL